MWWLWIARTKKTALYRGAYLIRNPKAALQAYVKHWRIEVFFRVAKQELGMGQCHSTSETHHHAHLQVLFDCRNVTQFTFFRNKIKKKRVMIKASPTVKWSEAFSTLVTKFVAKTKMACIESILILT